MSGISHEVGIELARSWADDTYTEAQQLRYDVVIPKRLPVITPEDDTVIFDGRHWPVNRIRNALAIQKAAEAVVEAYYISLVDDTDHQMGVAIYQLVEILEANK